LEARIRPCPPSHYAPAASIRNWLGRSRRSRPFVSGMGSVIWVLDSRHAGRRGDQARDYKQRRASWTVHGVGGIVKLNFDLDIFGLL
jgi:hypothetical protein